ncbi:hypothetical protein LTR29_003520 [Friedmanniomyces endolithicus]|nr:hypothetical protein LTR29_003520 [Friedmanniomyces endolithicus]
MSTIAKGSTVLVTGANGYIATHVVDQLLRAGYKVRGTVRSCSKAEWMHKLLDLQYGPGTFETVIVPDMVADGAFDEAVKSVSGIVHLATIATFSDKYEEVVPPTIKGALNILESARKEPGVKSLVYTSSSSAALLPQADTRVVVTAETWNDTAVEIARNDPGASGFVVYAASKTEAERAVWRVVEETKPGFRVAAVLPSGNFGRMLRPGFEGEASTGSWVVSLFKGEGEMAFLDMPPFRGFLLARYPVALPELTISTDFIDVVDDARLHVAALINPSCAGKRIFAFARPFTWNDVLAIFRNMYPERKFRDDIEVGRDLSEVPNQEAEELLRKHYGHGWTSLEESVKANVAMLA